MFGKKEEEKGFFQKIFSKREEEPKSFMDKLFKKEEVKPGMFGGIKENIKENMEERKKKRERKVFLRSLIPSESTAIRLGIVLFMILLGLIIFIVVEKYSIYFVQKDEFRTGIAIFSVILYLPFARKIIKFMFIMVPVTLITLLTMDIMQYYEYIEGSVGTNKLLNILESLFSLN
jgi:hypothetical protein